jgi:hypothetical protein
VLGDVLHSGPQAKLIRINRDHPECKAHPLACIAIRDGGLAALQRIDAALERLRA